MPEHPCPAHEYLVREIEFGFKHVGEKIDAMSSEMSRRMDESREDRAALHEQHNSLAREVSTAMTRLNGAILLKSHHRQDDTTESLHLRKSDTLGGWVRENWVVLTAIVAAAFAGEKLVPFMIDLVGRLFK